MVNCDRCDRYFRTISALHQHEQSSSAHNLCDECGIDFVTWTGLKGHWVQSRRHFYCQKCDEHFPTDAQLLAHAESEHYNCEPCRKMFKNQLGLKEHYRQSDAHYYCTPCNRLFGSASNLQAHLNSSTHRPKDVPCPFKGCGHAFVSRSALILHLESGSCRSGVDRDRINYEVCRLDTDNVITDPSRLLTGPAASQEVKYYATDAAWNGSAYECYFCHNTFRSLPALNEHLASPKHQNKIYVCPLSTCCIRFTTLSALCQHVESERCGVYKFRAVQNAMDSIVGQMGRLTF
ncbi:hypothetical protein Hypma_013457 [Hypsizygus marmoreus]|uniref:C2H2-type domain-containing protein n=1 Tax=Hypsizygus marmoreus TaxID=39966 RepID=A0A369JJB4_HYPMA|nr:hypothetical protein Hypma_013457 [Hypsizygus marmoreus]